MACGERGGRLRGTVGAWSHVSSFPAREGHRRQTYFAVSEHRWKASNSSPIGPSSSLADDLGS